MEVRHLLTYSEYKIGLAVQLEAKQAYSVQKRLQTKSEIRTKLSALTAPTPFSFFRPINHLLINNYSMFLLRSAGTNSRFAQHRR